jgi:hypothetical protein
MKRPRPLSHKFPLFAGALAAEPSHVWETLDDATRRQVVERAASLLLAHAKADARRCVSSSNPSNEVNTP